MAKKKTRAPQDLAHLRNKGWPYKPIVIGVCVECGAEGPRDHDGVLLRRFTHDGLTTSGKWLDDQNRCSDCAPVVGGGCQHHRECEWGRIVDLRRCSPADLERLRLCSRHAESLADHMIARAS